MLLSYKDAKSKLRRAQWQQSEKVYFQKFEELDRAASGDHRMFRKLLRNRNKNDTVQIQSLQVGNQTVKDDNVVEGFAEHYRGVFDFHYTEPCTELVHTIRAYVQNAECNNNNNYLSQISELEIHKACKHLKRGKAAWLDGVTSEHILCGGKPVVMALKALFNLVLDTETCLNDWKQCIIVPIYQG